MYRLLYDVTAETIEGKTIELASRIERRKAAELVVRLRPDLGEELVSVDADLIAFEPIPFYEALSSLLASTA